ncbi:MAG: S-methyl-5-thioribose-1-phosphate isomerase, partial [Desulfatitalea sp.]
MKVDGKEMRPIWLDADGRTIKVIDQRQLPHRLVLLDLTTVGQVIEAIVEMVVRGAPLIGVTGAYGVLIALLTAKDEPAFIQACQRIEAARPTAVNLAWAVARVSAAVLRADTQAERLAAAHGEAAAIDAEEVARCRRIGEHGAALVVAISRARSGRTVHILTHCNAGWLATVDWGTALSPIYQAHNAGIPIHVWVDETRPRNQGAS